MVHNYWDELYSKLAKTSDTEHASKPPTLDSFEQFEDKYGVRLPQSYKAFATRFGPGILGGFFRIAVPGYAGPPPWFDLDRLNQHSMRTASPDYIEEIHCGKVPPSETRDVVEQIKRMLFFCTLDGEEYIGWDPDDVSDAESNEYGIFILPRIDPPIYCGCSFAQFISEICLGDKFPDYADVDRESWMKADRQVFLAM